MKVNFKRWIIPGALVVSLLVLTRATWAAPNAASVDWWVIGGGGGSDTICTTYLGGTLGQWTTSNNTVADTQLCAGFWCGVEAQHLFYLPLVLRSS
jgi:hypothetical protein